MRPWLWFALGAACLGLAAVIWAVGARRAGAGWICPMCGTQGRWAAGRGMIAPGPSPAPFHVEPRESYHSPGERIYHTGIGLDGRRISFRAGPHWLHMHGGACINCHGPGGIGDRPIPPTGTKAPDIRYRTLAAHRHGDDQHEHAYSDQDLRRAMTRGVAPDGAPLDPLMPRFDMSDQDLEAVIDYLKQLDAD